MLTIFERQQLTLVYDSKVKVHSLITVLDPIILARLSKKVFLTLHVCNVIFSSLTI